MDNQFTINKKGILCQIKTIIFRCSMIISQDNSIQKENNCVLYLKNYLPIISDFLNVQEFSTKYPTIEIEVSGKNITLFFKNLFQHVINMEMHIFLAFFHDATGEEKK